MPPFNDESISPGNVTRAWDTTLEVADKLEIHINAGEHVGGNVVVRYLTDGQDLTVHRPEITSIQAISASIEIAVFCM